MATSKIKKPVTYSNATTSASGLMSAADKVKLNNFRLFKSSTNTDKQTFDLSSIASDEKPTFLFAVGFSTDYLLAYIAINVMSESGVGYSVIASKTRTISAVAYNPSTKTLTVTLNGNVYRRGALLGLQYGT